MMPSPDDNQVELVTVDYLRALGYEHLHGPVIAPDGEAPERQDYGQVVLTRRLRDALVRINPDVPDEAIEDALGQVMRTDLPAEASAQAGDPARQDDNEFLLVNQFTVMDLPAGQTGNKRNRCPADVVALVHAPERRPLATCSTRRIE